MKITIDKNSGFCWGVVRTVDVAEEVLQESPELYSLGPVIHNPMETDRLKNKGLETVTYSDLGKLGGKKVLIRAHGEPPSTYALARKLGIELIDTTCPVVTKVQERIRKFYDKGFQIVIFGKKDHAEVIGLVGNANNEAIVIKSVEETSKVDFTRKTVLFSQTTMDKPTFYEIARVLKEKIKSEFEIGTFEESALAFHAKDTICGQVSGRDRKLREYASQNDVMIFVAGRNSSNGKVLYEICKEANANTHFIEDVDELKREWFVGKETIGISGATSTPHLLMEKVKVAIDFLMVPAETQSISTNVERDARESSHH